MAEKRQRKPDLELTEAQEIKERAVWWFDATVIAPNMPDEAWVFYVSGDRKGSERADEKGVATLGIELPNRNPVRVWAILEGGTVTTPIRSVKFPPEKKEEKKALVPAKIVPNKLWLPDGKVRLKLSVRDKDDKPVPKTIVEANDWLGSRTLSPTDEHGETEEIIQLKSYEVYRLVIYRALSGASDAETHIYVYPPHAKETG